MTKVTPPALEIENAVKSFGAGPVLNGVSFEVRRGAILGLCGENGAGKSTLLRCVAGALRPDQGRISVAGRTPEEFDDALEILSVAPTFRDEGWLRTAFEVRKKYPQNKYRSLGIPTWFYGHEPATPFATHIAKYFFNSLREDVLLAIAKGGIIYSPGSAGTIQEIFQDAAQNHYETFGAPSPMVFLDKEFFTKDVPVYPLLEDLLTRGKYKNLLISVTDDAQEAIDTLMSFRQEPTAEC